MKKILLFIFLLLAIVANAKVYYVNVNYSGAVKNGLSWQTPFTVLDSAIAKATDGDQIWMAKGTYKPANTDFFIDKAVSIYGGFVGNETTILTRDWKNNQTVLDGDSANGLIVYWSIEKRGTVVIDGLGFTDSRQCLDLASDSVEFVVKNCSFTNTNAGIQVWNALKCEITDCQFKNISAYAIEAEDPISITNCQFKNITGDAIEADDPIEVTNCDFSENGSFELDEKAEFNYCKFRDYPGEVFNGNSSDVLLYKCDFFNNRGTLLSLDGADDYKFLSCNFYDNDCWGILQQGEGPYILFEDCKFLNNVFQYNMLDGYGGGIFYNGCLFEKNRIRSVTEVGALIDDSDIKVYDCQFLNNNAQSIKFIGGSPIVKDCHFENNTTSNAGGAIYASGVDTLTITGSTFINNTSTNKNSAGNGGGAVYANLNYTTISDCIFERNKSQFGLGGGLYVTSNKIKLNKITFKSNESTQGGGLYAGGNEVTLSDCVLDSNRSEHHGGGAYISTGNGLVYNSVFKNNIAGVKGFLYPEGAGAYFTSSDFKVYNSVFCGNKFNTPNTSGRGGGLKADNTRVYNSTFSNNEAPLDAGIFLGVGSVYNSIVWGNKGNDYRGGTYTYTGGGPVSYLSQVYNSNIGGKVEGNFTNVTSLNPKFVNAEGCDLRLSCESPLINMGNNDYTPPYVDLSGKARVFGSKIDLGAYEFPQDPKQAGTPPVVAFSFPDSVCKNEQIHFKNTTVPFENTKFEWTFGDSTASTELNPIHGYPVSKKYNISLTATNSCGASSVLSKSVFVKSVFAPTITYPTVVCAFGISEFETKATCSNLLWTVSGGTIVSGQGTKKIKVTWGNGNTGNGKVKLLATACGAGFCEIPVDVEVPIVPASYTINGSSKVCQSTSSIYSLSNKANSPSTIFSWKVEGGSIIGENTGYDVKDINVVWNSSDTTGKVTLYAHNELLGCGDTTEMAINIRPKFDVSGTSQVCEASEQPYKVNPVIGTFSWSVSVGNTIDKSTGIVKWGKLAGKQLVIAKADSVLKFCNVSDTLTVSLINNPVITKIVGEMEVDTNSTEFYKVESVPSDLKTTWKAIGGTEELIGNEAKVKWGNKEPFKLIVNTYTSSPVCYSKYDTVLIKKAFVFAINGPSQTCIFDTATYNATTDPTSTVAYNWGLNADDLKLGTSLQGFRFQNPGMQTIQLSVLRNGKTYLVKKNVDVKATPTNLGLKGPVDIDENGLGTYTYEVSNPDNIGYEYQVTGAKSHAKNGNIITVTWNGVGPFSVTAIGLVANSVCKGSPVRIVANKVPPVSNRIVSSSQACLNKEVTYTFETDKYASKLVWSVTGGTIISQKDNYVTVQWGMQAGSYSVGVSYERFGVQSASFAVVISPLASPEITDGVICGTSPVDISTKVKYISYKWTQESNAAVISTSEKVSISQEGYYNVKVADANGCEGNASVYVKQVPLPEVNLTSDNVVNMCFAEGSLVKLPVTLSTLKGEGYTYEWYKNNQLQAETSPKLSFGLAEGVIGKNSYYVIVTRETCTARSSTINSEVYKCDTGGTGNGCTMPAVAFKIQGECQPFTFVQTSGPADNIVWNLGDNTTSTNVSPIKSYAKPGVYFVTLKRGCAGNTLKVDVPASANYKLETPSCVGQEASFKNLTVRNPDRKIESWVWSFGDGTSNVSGSGDYASIKHTFTKAGTYAVSLTVSAKNADSVLCTNRFSQDITVFDAAVASIAVVLPPCTDNVYAFSYSGTFPTSNMKFAWDFGSGQTSSLEKPSAKLAASANTLVKLNVMDVRGCAATASKTLAVPAVVKLGEITVQGERLLCAGASTKLLAPVGTNYVWKKDGIVVKDSVKSSLTVKIAGNYTLTYTNGTCSLTTNGVAISTFSVAPTIVANAKACIGDSWSMATGLDGKQYSFVWKKGAVILGNTASSLFIPTITSTDAGTYSVSITDNASGCKQDLGSKIVAVFKKPSIPTVSVDDESVCFGGDFVLTEKDSLTTAKTLKWKLDGNVITGTNATLKISKATEQNRGYYSAEVIDQNSGCSAQSNSLFVNVAPAIDARINRDTLLCEKAPFEIACNLQSSDYDFQWYKKGQTYGVNDSKISFLKTALSDSGSYYAVVTSRGTVGLKSCTASTNTMKLKVQAAPSDPIITGPEAFCTGSKIKLSNSLTSNIVWSTGEKTSSINVSLGGNYSLTVTNPVTGCKSTQTKVITQNPLPDFSFFPFGVYERCGNSKITFEALADYPYYQWYVDGKKFGSPNTDLYPTVSGKYTLELKTDKQCVATSDTIRLTSLECPCLVTNIQDAGDGSLREAVICSNLKRGKDIIKFQIPGTGPFVIKLLSELPTLADSVFINGFSQSGTKNISVTVDGQNAVKNAFVLESKASNSQISGLGFANLGTAILMKPLVNKATISENKMHDISGNAVELSSNCNRNTIKGNSIETNNYAIVLVSDAKQNVISENTILKSKAGIGLFSNSTQNTISKNTIANASENGVFLFNTSNRNTLSENKLSKSGMNGLLLDLNSSNNIIDSNWVGSNAYGIVFQNGSKGNTATRNYIGTDNANLDLGNKADGFLIRINSDSNIIAKNFIQYNDSSNVKIWAGSKYNLVDRNVIAHAGKKGIELKLTGSFGNEKIASPVIVGLGQNTSSDSLEISGTVAKSGILQLFEGDGGIDNALKFVKNNKISVAGNWNLKLPTASLLAGDKYYLATITDAKNNTSEFSPICKIKIYDGNCIVTTLADTGKGSLREAVNCANNSIKAAKISFKMSGVGPYAFVPKTPLASLNNIFKYSIDIDGASQITSGTGTGDQSIVLKGTKSGLLNWTITNTHFASISMDSVALGMNASIVDKAKFRKSATAIEVQLGKNEIRNSRFEGHTKAVTSTLLGPNVSISGSSFFDNINAVVYSGAGKGKFVLIENDFNYSTVLLSTTSKDISLSKLDTLIATGNYFGSFVTTDACKLVEIKKNNWGYSKTGGISTVSNKGMSFINGAKLSIEGNRAGSSLSDMITIKAVSDVLLRKNIFGFDSLLKQNMTITGKAINATQVQNISIVSNSVFNTTGIGIYVKDTLVNAFAKMILVDSNVVGAENKLVYGNGIHLENLPKLLFSNNTVSNTKGNGLNVRSSKSAQLLSNIFKLNDGQGLELFKSDKANLFKNSSTNNGQNGMNILSCSSAKVDNNTISNNSGFGLIISDLSNSNTVSNNQIFSNSKGGILVTDTSNANQIVANILQGNKTSLADTFGIQISNRSIGQLVLRNELTDYKEVGIKVDHFSQAKLSRNLVDTTKLAIDLNLSKTTIGNSAKSKPTLTTLIKKGNYLILSGTSEKADSIEVFVSNFKNEKLSKYLITIPTDGLNNWSARLPLTWFGTNPDTLVFRATATSVKGTSQLSNTLWYCPFCKCLVTNTANEGNESLRDAINKSNKGECGIINFKISPDLTADTIRITTLLPKILNAVWMDGSSESGHVVSKPVVWIKDNSRNLTQGLQVASVGSVVQGLGIEGFTNAIEIQDNGNKLKDVVIGRSKNRYVQINADSNTVEKSFLGAKYDSSAFGNFSGQGVSVSGNYNMFSSTMVANTHGENILIEYGIGNTYFNGSLFGSGRTDFARRLGIKLVSGANSNMPRPAFASHVINASGIILTGKAENGSKVQIYKGNGTKEQALTYLGETFADGNSGVWNFATSDFQTDKGNAYLGTATNGQGSTSQLSDVYRIGTFEEVCPVTNVNDSGEGSFRSALDCANNSDLRVKIDFQFPDQSAKEIKITTSPVLKLTNMLGATINGAGENLTISSSVPANNLIISGAKNTISSIDFSLLGFQLENSSDNYLKKTSFKSSGLTLLGNSDFNRIDSNIFTFTGIKIGNDVCACASSNTISNNQIGYTKDGSKALSNDFGLLVISKEGDNKIVGNNISESAKAALVSVQPKGIVSGNKVGAIDADNYPYGIVALGKGSKVFNNTVLGADTGIASAIPNWITSQQASSIGRLDSVSIENDTINARAVGVLVKDVSRVLISKVIIKETGSKGILLNSGNELFQRPTFRKYTLYENNLHIIGKAKPWSIVELFESNAKGERSLNYVATINTREDGFWEAVIPQNKININGDNYFVATARDGVNNTSEFSDKYNAFVRICLVTTNANDAKGSFREAIDLANGGGCNVIQFNIPTNPRIALETMLPEVHASNIIIDGSSQPNYGAVPVKVSTASGKLPTGLGVSKSVNFSMHSLSFENHSTAIRLKGAENSYLRRNNIADSDTAINADAKSGLDTWIEANTINGLGQGVNVGIVSEGDSVRIASNWLNKVVKAGINASGQGTKVNLNVLDACVETEQTDKSAAIYVANAKGLIIEGNIIHVSAKALLAENLEAAKITFNVIDTLKGFAKSKRLIGLQLKNCVSSEIGNNTINDSLVSGILVEGSSANILYNNTISRVDKAINLSTSVHNELRYNTLKKNKSGIVLNRNSDKNALIFNTIHTNSDTGMVILSNNNVLKNNLLGSISKVTKEVNKLGIFIQGDSNAVGSPKAGNTIGRNKFGGVYVTGKFNSILYNMFFVNDTSFGRPHSLAISLNNKIGNESIKAPFIDTYEQLTDTTYRVYGMAFDGDSIHMYLNHGYVQDALKFLGRSKADSDGNWSIVLNTKNFDRYKTTYVVSTATNARLNTSEFSNMIPIGPCYISEITDNGDSEYPLQGTVRAAIGCANSVPERAKILTAVNGYPNTIAVDTLQRLTNKRGFDWNGRNLLGYNQKLTISRTERKAKARGLVFSSKITAPVNVSNLSLFGFENGIEANVAKMKADTLVLIGFASKDSLAKNAIITSSIAQRHQFKNIEVQDFKTFYKKANSIDSLTLTKGAFKNVGAFNSAVNQFTNSSVVNLNWVGFDSVFTAARWKNIKIEADTFVLDKCDRAKPSVLIKGDSAMAVSLQNLVYSSNGCKNTAAGYELISLKNVRNVKFNSNKIHMDSSDVAVHLGSDSASSGSVEVLSNEIKTNGGVGLVLGGHDVDVFDNNVRAGIHAVLGLQLDSSTMLRNHFYAYDSSIVRLVQSTQVLMSRNVMYGNYKNKKAINIIKGDLTKVSNRGRMTPEIVNDITNKYNGSLKPRRLLTGRALPGDKIEMFLSDSARPNLMSYVSDSAIADKAGDWVMPLPKEWQKRHKGAYFITVTATDSAHTTSEVSNVYRLDTLMRLIYVRNTKNAGPNSLREAVDQINSTDFYTKVIFKIPNAGPHIIKIDSLYQPVYNYSGFKIDGKTQKDSSILKGVNQDIFVDAVSLKGIRTDTLYAFNFLPETGPDTKVNTINLINFSKGILLQSPTVVLDSVGIYGGSFVGDTALHVSYPTGTGGESNIKNCVFQKHTTGLMLDPGLEEMKIESNRFDSLAFGIVMNGTNKQSVISKNNFINIDTTGILLREGSLETIIQGNIFGIDLRNKQLAATMNNAVCLDKVKQAIVDSNTIVRLSQTTEDRSAGKGIFVKNGSTNNNITKNVIGYIYLGTDTVQNQVLANTSIKGICVDSSSNNDVVSNRIGQVHVGIDFRKTSINKINANKIGVDTLNKKVFTIDSSAIQIREGSRDEIVGNLVGNYSFNGINLQSSKRIAMRKNNLYAVNGLNKGINLNKNSNDTVMAPVIIEKVVQDTNTIFVKGHAHKYKQGVIEVFVGYKGNRQSFKYVDRLELNGDTAWSMIVKKPFIDFDTNNYFVATYTDLKDNTSEFSNSYDANSLLCGIDTLPLIPYLKTCPGVTTKLDAGISGMKYNWAATNGSTFEGNATDRFIKVKKADIYTVTVSDKFGCVRTKSVKLELFGKAVEPDFIVAGQVFTNDTVAIIDISDPQPTDIKWDFDGARVLADLSKNVRYQYVVFPDSGSYNITQKSYLDKCEIVLEKKVLAKPRGTTNPKSASVTLPVIASIASAMVYPVPVDAGFATFKLQLTAPTSADVFISRANDGVDIYKRSFLESDFEAVDDVFDLTHNFYLNELPSGMYLVRVVIANETKTIKITVVR